MKKIISLFMSFVMIYSLILTVSADYRGPVDGIEMVPGINPVVRIKSDNQYDYIIYARDMDGMTNGDFTLYYDKEVLTLVTVKVTADFDGYFVNDVGGTVYFSYLYNEENEHDALKMYVLTFRYTKPGIYPSMEVTNMAGTYIKSVADVKVVKGEDYDSDDSYDDGKVPDSQYPRGDVNGDGKVSASDARTALRVAAGLETVSLEQFLRADLDSDGDVIAAEARTILRIAAGLEK